MKAKYSLATEQTEFLFFRRCTRTQQSLPFSAWHGKEAAGGFLFLGKYTIDDDAEQYVHFNELPDCTQWASACWHAKHEPTAPEAILQRFQREICMECKADLRVDCQQQARGLPDGRFLGYGQPRGLRSTIVGFRFVSYPEEVYAELVRTNAANGRVSLDNNPGPNGLGPLVM